jgi:hypothetical protein
LAAHLLAELAQSGSLPLEGRVIRVADRVGLPPPWGLIFDFGGRLRRNIARFFGQPHPASLRRHPPLKGEGMWRFIRLRWRGHNFGSRLRLRRFYHRLRLDGRRWRRLSLFCGFALFYATGVGLTLGGLLSFYLCPRGLCLCLRVGFRLCSGFCYGSLGRCEFCGNLCLRLSKSGIAFGGLLSFYFCLRGLGLRLRVGFRLCSGLCHNPFGRREFGGNLCLRLSKGCFVFGSARGFGLRQCRILRRGRTRLFDLVRAEGKDLLDKVKRHQAACLTGSAMRRWPLSPEMIASTMSPGAPASIAASVKPSVRPSPLRSIRIDCLVPANPARCAR